MKDTVANLLTNRIVLYAVLALAIVLMIVVVMMNRPSFIQLTGTPTTEVVALSTVSGSSTAGAPSQITSPIALATPWGVVGLDGSEAEGEAAEPATPLPDLPPVTLLGPPPDSQFRLGDRVTFYWDWPVKMTDQWQYALYVQSDAGASRVGTAEAENLGTVQQLGVTLAGLVSEPGSYQWQVVVEDNATGAVLARSENRPIVLMTDKIR